MPRYIFDVIKLPPSLDPVVEDLPNDEAAWREATIMAGQLFKDFDGRIRPGEEWALDVSDENQSALFHIQISTQKLK